MPENVGEIDLHRAPESPLFLNDEIATSDVKSSVLSGRLDQYVQGNPEFNPESVSNVWRFIDQIRLKENNQIERLNWSRYFRTLDDFRLFHRLNPDWANRSRAEMRDSADMGRSFYVAYARFCNQFPDRHEGERRLNELFPSKVHRWLAFTSEDDFKHLFNQRPEWHGKSRKEMDDSIVDGGSSFIQAYRTFLNNKYRDPDTGEVDKAKVEERFQELFPRRIKSWEHLRTEADFRDYWNQHPEWHGLNVGDMQRLGADAVMFYRKVKAFKRVEGDTTAHQDLMYEFFPTHQGEWINFTTEQEFIDYFNSRPDWQGRSVVDMNKSRDGGNGFMQAYRKFLAKKYMNPTSHKVDGREVKKAIEALFVLKRRQWEQMQSPERFQEIWNEHPEWHGLSTSEMLNLGGLAESFYYKLRRYSSSFVNPKTNLPDSAAGQSFFESFFPKKRKDWLGLGLTSEEAFIDYFNSHPEWQGRTRKQMQDSHDDGANGFIQAYRAFLRDKFRDPETGKVDKDKMEEAMDRLIFRQKSEWTNFTTEQEFIDYFNSRSDWQGRSRAEMDDSDDGSYPFIAYYRKFLRSKFRDPETGEVDMVRMEEALSKLIPRTNKDYVFENGKRIVFDSRPERIMAMLLYKYGMLNNPIEGVNVHPRINKTAKYSFDFLVGDVFLEFHPLHRREINEGIDLSNAMDSRLAQITKQTHIGKPVYHIWEIEQLYDIVNDPLLNPNIRKGQSISKEQFQHDLDEVERLASEYDRLSKIRQSATENQQNLQRAA